MVLVVISQLLFVILFIGVLSLFFLTSLARGLLILSIFSKNQFLVSLIRSIVFVVSVSLIPVLIFIISFLLLALDFMCCSFSSSFKCKVGLFEIFLAS